MANDEKAIRDQFLSDPSIIFAADRQLASVFAEFGAAVYVAQVMEHGLYLLLAFVMKHDDVVFSPESIEKLREKGAERSIGEVFHAVKKKEYFTDAEQRILQKAIWKRNIIVHNFMVENAVALTTPDGQAQIKAEIRGHIRDMRTADGVIQSLIERHLARHDTTMDDIKEYWQELHRGN